MGYLIVCKRQTGATIKVNTACFAQPDGLTRYPIINGLALAVGGIICRQKQRIAFQRLQLLAFYQDSPFGSFICTGMPGFPICDAFHGAQSRKSLVLLRLAVYLSIFSDFWAGVRLVDLNSASQSGV